MLINLYILIELTALVCLVIGLLPRGESNKRNWLPLILAFVLFLFLSFLSADIETENCEYVISTTSLNASSNVTTFAYNNSCETTSHREIYLMYLNIALAFLSAILTIGFWFVNEGGI